MLPKLRNAWLMAHRWIGLTAGLMFAFSGLTGSLIVFHLAIDEWLNAGTMLTRNHGQQLSMSEIVSAAEQASPVLGRIVHAYYPRVPNGVFILQFRESDSSGKSEAKEVFVDPVTAEILGQRQRNSGMMAFIHRLHANLLSGEGGRSLLGGLAMLITVSLMSGLILWWPLIRKGFRTGLAIRRRTLIFDLHKSLGAAFSPILLVIALTGIYLGLPDIVKPLVRSFSEETKLPGKVKSTVPTDKRSPIGPDAAARIAGDVMPGCRVMSIELPIKADDSYRVFVRQVGEVGELRGVGRVWIDQYGGDCLATRDWRQFTFADTYFRIQLALHSGDAFGQLGRCLFCVGGLIPMILYVTGFILWRQRKRSQLIQRQQRETRAEMKIVAAPAFVKTDSVASS